jgi:hypothetical protein
MNYKGSNFDKFQHGFNKNYILEINRRKRPSAPNTEHAVPLKNMGNRNSIRNLCKRGKGRNSLANCYLWCLFHKAIYRKIHKNQEL